MGLINETLRVLNEAAFGDIRNVFKRDEGFDFRLKPIGLYQKSYDYMLAHLYRNIGNVEFMYDGFGTPVGEMSNPFYNTIVRVPWFYLDSAKQSTANYIEYVKSVYGATLSVKNINEDNDIRLDDDAIIVGVHDDASLSYVLNVGPTENNYEDTKIGNLGKRYLYQTAMNAIPENDRRKSYGDSITVLLPNYFGLNTDAVTEHSITDIGHRRSPETGRFEGLSPLMGTDSPVYNSNYGHAKDFGSYTGYYNSLSENAKKFLHNNLYGQKDEDLNREVGNKYYPGLRISTGEINEDGIEKINTVITGNTYFKEVGVSVVQPLPLDNGANGYLIKGVNGLQSRYLFTTDAEHSNLTDATQGGVYVYSESENGTATNMYNASFNFGTKFSMYTTYGSGLQFNDLLKKTNEGFRNGKYDTIIARFHTDSTGDTTDTTQTAISHYGLSHGRNLLKLTPDDSEGYENPYCRVWTYHHQYKSLQDTIRPLPYDQGELYSKYNFSAFTADHSNEGFGNGRERLRDFGVLNKHNGLVNITPIDNSDVNKKVDIKNCMFSIENLAWKDAFSTDQKSRESFQAGGLSSEQKGPFGGRIMWFPPYDLSFNEDISVNWNETNFIGRGEGIYTYTNTKRTGNLHFKLLVDHPSIINYWKGRGMSTSNSVDDKNDPEQEILRFFAGCDMLTARETPTPEPETVLTDEAIPSPTTDYITFYVFFPNNYSGVDDDTDFAIKYLANGVGAGAERKYTKNSQGQCIQSKETTTYQVPLAPVENGYGGYEIRPGKPISIVSTQNDGNLKIADVKIGNLTGCNNGKTSLYVIEGNSSDKWWQRKWYYRIDNKYKDQLLKKESYIDRNSYGLNSKLGLEKVAESFGIKDEDKQKLMAFSDVFFALEGNAMQWDGNIYDAATASNLKNKKNRIDHITCVGKASTQGHEELNKKLQQDRANTIKKWLASKGLCDANKIYATTGGEGGEGTGINSGDESSISNKIWRSVEVKIFLKEESSKTTQAAASENILGTAITPEGNVTGHELNNISGDTTNVGITRTPVFNDLSSNKFVEEQVLKDRITSIRLNKLSDGINGLAMNLREAVRHRTVNLNTVFNAVADFSEYERRLPYSSLGQVTNYDRGKSDYEYNTDEMHDNAAKTNTSLNNTEKEKTGYTLRDGTNNNKKEVRYDNEATFFSLLEKEEPFLHHKISDKIKYFDPAFHSISPEGFNARLTFLQQCARQGPTVGASDSGAETTANNLSFGRPPVCILRLGDFYYTKIIIDNISIRFDPLMWDLNSEGIGVMPMIADIDIRFNFIGGSSLAGHITRLQNAVSFNYYANTEVYDNRSELAEYDENGNISRLAPYNPTL